LCHIPFPKAAGDIASVTAEFPRLVSVCGKIRATARAGKIVCSFSIELVGVRYPPSRAAFIGTEFFYFSSGDYLHFLSALFAICNVRACLFYLMKIVPLAIGFDCIL